MNKHLKTILLGIAAGAAIALGGFLNIVAKTIIPNSDISKLVGSLLFPIGLTLVCYLGLNLFTGKIGYLLDNDKNYIGFLVLIYLGNIIGSLIIGFTCYFIFKNVPELYSQASAIGNAKANITNFISGFNIFVGSCVCGALVYIAVFCYKKMPNNVLKIIGISLPIALFVYLGNDHCVANMYYFTFAFKFSDWKSYLNIAIATVGNSLGAIAINSLAKLAAKN